MIDMHAHFLPALLVEALTLRASAPNISRGADGNVSIGIYRTRMPYRSSFDDVEARIALMDELGISKQVLSLPGLFGIDSLPASDAVLLTRLFNDGVAELATKFPDRFVGIAALPIADPTAAVDEYRRAREELGLAGMVLPGDGFTSVAQARSLRPLFNAAQDLGGLVFVHPGPLPFDTTGEGLDAPAPHSDNIVHRRATVDIQNRLTEVMITLAISDFLDEFGDVPVQVANLGGSLPFVIERMDHVYGLRHPELALPSKSLKPIYVDCASMGRKALAMAIDLYGADRILFGTDNPVFDDRRAIDAVKDSLIDEADKDKILKGNATQLLETVTTQ
ncbi:MAG: amidohydrolase family protein [Acidimicrobiales bacterium]